MHCKFIQWDHQKQVILLSSHHSIFLVFKLIYCKYFGIRKEREWTKEIVWSCVYVACAKICGQYTMYLDRQRQLHQFKGKKSNFQYSHNIFCAPTTLSSKANYVCISSS